MTTIRNVARPINILLVEDDDDDVKLISKMLKKVRALNSLHRVRDGVEAMRYLRKESPFVDAVRPDLVLLDLNMPRMDGREVLKACENDDSLKLIPVVVFTSSDDERDVLQSYGHNATSYVTKPIDLIQFRDVIKTLTDYWFGIVSLPPVM